MVEVSENNVSQLGFILHPLPLLNISDYYTRCKITGEKNHIGILFGTRNDRDVAVENAFEIEYENNKVNQEFMNKRIAEYKLTFPNQDAIGWYQVRTSDGQITPDEESLHIHEQMQLPDDLDLSLLLIFNPKAETIGAQLPLKAYELLFREKDTQFAEVAVRVETSDAERIGVDDIMKGDQLQNGQQLDSHLVTEANAIDMFYRRLKILRDYVEEVKNGNVEPNHQVLRKINAFMSRVSQQRDLNLQTLLDQQELSVLSAGLMSAVVKGEQLSIDILTKNGYINNTVQKDKDLDSMATMSNMASMTQ